jgi:hypothetical protein
LKIRGGGWWKEVEEGGNDWNPGDETKMLVKTPDSPWVRTVRHAPGPRMKKIYIPTNIAKKYETPGEYGALFCSSPGFVVDYSVSLPRG